MEDLQILVELLQTKSKLTTAETYAANIAIKKLQDKLEEKSQLKEPTDGQHQKKDNE